MAQKTARATAKGAQFTFFGVLTLVADVLPVKPSEAKVETKLVCPDLDVPTQLKQQYVVPGRDDLGPYTQSSAARAMEVDGELKFVTSEQLEELRNPTLPDGECDFSVFPAEDVAATTIPSGTAYRLRPAKMTPGSKAQQAYAMLVDLVADAGNRDEPVAFIGEVTIKGAQRMVRCESRDGNLVLVELVRPGELYPPVDVPLEYDGRLLDTASQLLEANVEKFDPEAFQSKVQQRAEAFKDSLRGVETTPEKPKAVEVEAEDSANDLLAALTASIDQVKKKPAPKKRAPRKQVAAKAA